MKPRVAMNQHESVRLHARPPALRHSFISYLGLQPLFNKGEKLLILRWLTNHNATCPAAQNPPRVAQPRSVVR